MDQRDADARIAERAQNLLCRLDIAYQYAFGDFDLQPNRQQTRFVEDAQHPKPQRSVCQLNGRDVEGEHDVLRPCARSPARLPEKLVGQDVDQTRVLCNWYEAIRRDIAQFLM